MTHRKPWLFEFTHKSGFLWKSTHRWAKKAWVYPYMKLSLFSMSGPCSVSNSLLYICWNSLPATTCSYYFLYQAWQTWAYSFVFVQLACWHIDVSRRIGGQPWRLSPFHSRKLCWCAHTSLLANFQCSHRVVLVSCCIIYSLLGIAIWFLEAIWIPEWSL